jgi:hypothetical protein
VLEDVPPKTQFGPLVGRLDLDSEKAMEHGVMNWKVGEITHGTRRDELEGRGDNFSSWTPR